MTRDLNLLRGIILFVEEQPAATAVHGHQIEERFPDFDKMVIADHALQLKEEDLIEGFVQLYPQEKMSKIRIERITSQGHDFILALKDDSVWSKMKAEVIDQGKAFSVAMLVQYATATAKAHLGLP